MSKRIYPVTVENGELVESKEKLTVNGLPISKDGTIDSSYVSGSGGSSEWEVDANGDLVPVDGEPVSVGSLSSDELSSIQVPPGSDLANYYAADTALWLRPGARYTTSVSVPKNNNMVIEGTQGTTKPSGGDPLIAYTGPTGAGTAVIDWSDATTPIEGTRIADVSIDAGGADHGLLGRYMTNGTHLENVKITNTASHAYDISKIWYSWLEDCVARTNIGGDGFRFHETGGQVTDPVLINPRTNGVSGAGVRALDSSMIGLKDPTLEGCDEEGLRFEGRRLYLNNGYFENNGKTLTTPTDIYLNGNVVNIDGVRTRGEPGGIGIDVAAGVAGVLTGTQHDIADSTNRPDYHIRSASVFLDVEGAWVSSYASVDSINIEGYVTGSKVSGSIVHRRTPTDLSTVAVRESGEVLIDDGTNTTTANIPCAAYHDGTQWMWQPANGDAAFAANGSA